MAVGLVVLTALAATGLAVARGRVMGGTVAAAAVLVGAEVAGQAMVKPVACVAGRRGLAAGLGRAARAVPVAVSVVAEESTAATAAAERKEEGRI